MLLIGHDTVLKDALARLPDFLPRCAAFFQLTEEQCWHWLSEGGHIPDLPDIEYATVENLVHVKGVKFRQSFLQQLLHIRKITGEVSQVLHSHRGLGSLGHSMYSILTRNRGPQHMGQAIVRRCAGWLDYISRLGTNDLRLSLFGNILHAVIDSYAPGHTLRLTPEQRTHLASYQCHTPAVVEPQPIAPGVLLAQAVLRLVKTHTPIHRDTLGQDPDLQTRFPTPQAWHTFWNHNQAEILGVQYMVQFEAQLDRMGQTHLRHNPKRSQQADDSYPAIVDFLSVSSTSLPVHHVSDWVRTLKKAGLYEYAVQDIVFVLSTFLTSFTDPPAAIQDLCRYLSQRTFNTTHAIPLRHKIHMKVFRARYCTEIPQAPPSSKSKARSRHQ